MAGSETSHRGRSRIAIGHSAADGEPPEDVRTRLTLRDKIADIWWILQSKVERARMRLVAPHDRAAAWIAPTGSPMTVSQLTLVPERVRLQSPPVNRELTVSSPSGRTVRADLRASTGDGALFSLMVGLGETYLPAFVLALGLGEIAAGLITTLPIMLGAILQLVTPWAVSYFGSARRWVVICAYIQAGSLLILLPLAIWPHELPSGIVFVAATLYWAAGMATGPAWNTWIERVVPARIRSRFFAARGRICHASSLTGFLIGGLLLQFGTQTSSSTWTFGYLFTAAAAARFASAKYLAAQSEGRVDRPSSIQSPVRGVHRGKVVDRSSGRLVLYLLAMQSAIYLAGPFFTPFMLSKLQFSYAEYTLLISLGFVGKMIAMPLWGRLAERHGARCLLWIGGVGIAPLSSLWIISQSGPFLICLQILSGVTWAAHELAILLMFVDSIPRAHRTRLLTYYNLGNACAMVCGGTLGGILLERLGQSHSAYLTLFGLSSFFRFVSLACLFTVRRPERTIEVPVTRTIAVRPSAGSIEQPVLAAIPRAPEHRAA